VGNLIGTAYPNGNTTTYTYNTLNRLTQMTNSGPNGLISSYTYTLGAAGNRLQVVEAGPATTGRTVSYTYDAVYRLTQETIDEPGTANDQTITYSYDAVGNRTQMNRAGVVTTYTYDNNDRLLTEASSAGTFTSTYDNNGNLRTHGNGTNTDSYTYDAENRLIDASVQTGTNPGPVTYTYDADGMRISKTAGGVVTTFLLDKNRDYAQVVVETTGSIVATYTYGNQLISQTRTGGGTHFYLTDGQLSTRHLTTSAGLVSDTYTYDAFGATLASAGSTQNMYLYTGEQFDPNMGFYYLRARYYNQATGRFITTDPLQGNIFDPVSLHRYLYTNANPVNNRDPSGQLTLTDKLIILVLIVLFIHYYLPKTPTERTRSIANSAGLHYYGVPETVLKEIPKGTEAEFAEIVRVYRRVVFSPQNTHKKCGCIAGAIVDAIADELSSRFQAFEVRHEGKGLHEWAYVRIKLTGKKVAVLDPIAINRLGAQADTNEVITLEFLPSGYAPVWSYDDHQRNIAADFPGELEEF